MHSVLTQLFALTTSPWFWGFLPPVGSFIGVASGTAIPALECLALAGALFKLPALLATTTPDIQYLSAILLLCWTTSCLVMVARFACSSNQWIDWNAPSFVQLILDFKKMWTKKAKESTCAQS
jgi:hypothetical protein